MIWHQILGNGLQSIVLDLIMVVFSHVLTEEEAMTITIVFITRKTEVVPFLQVATNTFLSGVHFICNQKSEVGGQMSEGKK